MVVVIKDNSGDGIDDIDKVSSRAIFISILIIIFCKVLIFSSDENFFNVLRYILDKVLR